MAEPPDLEEIARQEQQAVDRWDEGERDVEKIAAAVGLPVPEIRRVLIARGLTTFEGEVLHLSVSEIAAEHLRETFLFDVEIVAVEDPMSLPTELHVQCLRCGTILRHIVDPTAYAQASKKGREDLIHPLECEEEQGGCKRSASATKFEEVERSAIDYTRLVVADFHDEVQFSEVQEDVRVTVHLMGLRAPRGSRVRLLGRVIQESTESLKFGIVAEELKELEWRPAAPKMDADLSRRFTEIGRMPMESKRLQIAPDMVGRPLAQEGLLRTICSAMRIPDVNGKEIRGIINLALVGDTKTDKSESARDAAIQVHAPYVQAENAGRTGLTHTIDAERRILEWGLLPRNHGKLVVLDGLERWKPEMQGEIRAVMNDLEIRVDRMVHGRHAAAVRMIITLNPKKTSMGQYPFRCAAIPDTQPFPNGPDISRVDMWILSAEEDVSQADIVARHGVSRPFAPETFLQFVHWAWSRKSSQIEYTPTGVALIRERAAAMMKEYRCSRLPIVHGGFLDVLCRVSVSEAILSFSTTDGENVIVSDEHVERAADFLKRMCDAMELREFRLHTQEEAMLTGGEFLAVSDRIGKDGRAIINLLANHLNESMTAKEIAKALGGSEAAWTEDVVVHRYEDLKDEELIETTRGKGVVLTLRGIAFFKSYRVVDDLFRLKAAGTLELPARSSGNKSGGTPDEIEGWGAEGTDPHMGGSP